MAPVVRGYDPWLLVFASALTAFGLVVLASTTAHLDPGHPLYYVEHQLLSLAVGVVGMLVVARIDYRRLVRWSAWAYGLMIVLLLAVLVHGRSALGAERWIQVGPFPLQPSEFAKILLIIALAGVLDRMRQPPVRLRDLALPFAYALVPALLVMKQPDLGTAIVLLLIVGGMLYMAGTPARTLVAVYLAGLALAVGVIVLELRYGVHIPLVHNYQLRRLIVFLNPGLDRLGAGYNIIMSEIAIGSGGLGGTGLYRNWDQLTFLPESHTDFIFASLSMQLGFLGAAAYLVGMLLFLWRALAIAADARDRAGSLLAAGVVTMMAAHMAMNAGMAMGVMPVVGVPLPFVSYGGSALVTDALAIGLLENVYRRRHQVDFRTQVPAQPPLTRAL
jgi:rod shape determining protein RodA